MDEAARLRMGQRITRLRERSPYTQPTVAEKLGVGLRAYQKLEARGTTKFERCEEIAKIHAKWAKRSKDFSHADAQWIWDGIVPLETEGAPATNGTPDPFAEAESGGDDIAEIRGELAALREDMTKVKASLEIVVKKLSEGVDGLLVGHPVSVPDEAGKGTRRAARAAGRAR